MRVPPNSAGLIGRALLSRPLRGRERASPSNMFYGVTVLEGEAKRVCSLDLGRGKYNESSWCEKRIVTSRLSVDWRYKHTKFYKNFRHIIVVFVEQRLIIM